MTEVMNDDMLFELNEMEIENAVGDNDLSDMEKFEEEMKEASWTTAISYYSRLDEKMNDILSILIPKIVDQFPLKHQIELKDNKSIVMKSLALGLKKKERQIYFIYHKIKGKQNIEGANEIRLNYQSIRNKLEYKFKKLVNAVYGEAKPVDLSEMGDDVSEIIQNLLSSGKKKKPSPLKSVTDESVSEKAIEPMKTPKRRLIENSSESEDSDVNKDEEIDETLDENHDDESLFSIPNSVREAVSINEKFKSVVKELFAECDIPQFKELDEEFVKQGSLHSIPKEVESESKFYHSKMFLL